MKSKVDVLTASTSTKTKIPTVSKEELVDWVTTAWRVLEQQTELIKKSFIATGITAAGNRVKADTVLNDAYEKGISNSHKSMVMLKVMMKTLSMNLMMKTKTQTIEPHFYAMHCCLHMHNLDMHLR